jgi:phosphoglycerate kinase
MADTARRILNKAEGKGCAIILPVDAIVAYHFEANAPSHAYGVDAIPAEGMMLDVGAQSIERVKGALDEASTLVWNGPMGASELHPFEKATMDIAKYAAARTKSGKLVSVAGGGDTVAALNAAGVAEQFTYVSTAGGAFLEWMEGKPLPGVEVLRIK